MLRACLTRRCRVALLLTTGALLVGATAALALTGLTVRSHVWEVGVANGPTAKVATGKSFAYCASRPVASLQAKLDFSRTPAGAPYSVGLAGPPAAGKTPLTLEGDFNGKAGIVEPVYETLAFPKLRARGLLDLPPGRYVFSLIVSGKVALKQSITLVLRAGC